MRWTNALQWDQRVWITCVWWLERYFRRWQRGHGIKVHMEDGWTIIIMEQYNGIGYHNNKVKENDKKMASSGSHQAFSSKSYSFNSFRLLRYTLYRTPPLDNSNSRCNLPHLHVFILHIIIILMFIASYLLILRLETHLLFLLVAISSTLIVSACAHT